MKTKVALAVFSALALAGGAAHAANVVPTTTTTGQNGSDLVLFVSDATANTYFVYDTGITLDSVRTTSAIAGDGNMPSTTTGAITAPTISAAVDTALTNYLKTTASTDSISWALQGADSNSVHKNPTTTIGVQRYATSSAVDLTGAGSYTRLTNSQLGTIVGTTTATGMEGFFAEINAATYTNNVSASEGYGKGTLGAQSTSAFGQYSSSGATGGSVVYNGSSTETLYLFANNTTGNSGRTNTYASTQALTLTWNGTAATLAAVSAVPVPAAVWLFGSGLLGLMGVGRRRQVGGVAAA